MVYAFMRYFSDDFPEPKQRGMRAGFSAVNHMLQCHAVAYHTIKDAYPEVQVGMAKNMPVFQAAPGSGALSTWWAKRVDWLFNDSWLESMATGKVKRPFGNHTIKNLAGSYDFIGLNYYTRFYVKFPPGKEFISHDWGDEAVVSDGNYGEVYPSGLFQVIKRVKKYKKPIYITENGVPDQADALRPGFLLTHLREIWRAISFCFPVMGYYHWSLVDNFEWDRGWTQRFGLIAHES